MKKCNKCGETKSLEEFWKDTEKSDGLQTMCKECKLKYYDFIYPHRKINREKREYDRNIKKLLIILKKIKRKRSIVIKKNINEQHLICTKCGTTDQSLFSSTRKNRSKRLYKEIRKDWCINCMREYDKERKSKIIFDPTKILICPKCNKSGDFQSNLFQKNRYRIADKFCTCKKCRNTPTNKVRSQQAKRIKETLKRYFNYTSKIQSSMKYVGCTPGELVKYLESKFKDGMSWDNYGFYGWHIDHIIPVSSFDLSKEEDLVKCFHYTNLQPLWADENLRKSNKIISQ